MSSDEAIQLTNNDATNFKSYAVSKGYWNDPYINCFVSSLASKQQQSITNNQSPSSLASNIPEHKPPEMSRGYFARVNAIQSFVERFLNINQNSQIVNLGAGYDTLYFNLCDKNKLPVKYVEVDFPRIVSSKIRLIKSKKALNDKLIMNEEKPTLVVEQPAAPKPTGSLFAIPTLPVGGPVHQLHTLKFDIISADLRNTNDLDKKLKECNLDFSLPTLFIFECVLVYMTSSHSQALLKYLNQNFSQLCLINYEQCNLNDKFGEIMLSNMELRACKLLGVDVCQSVQSQIDRFSSAGFINDLCHVRTMSDFYKKVMDKNERNRIEQIEFLDETELLFQLMDHYCICAVTNNQEYKQILY